MDTITMGVTLSFVAEALERGWLSPSAVGVPFGWGDWRGMLRLVEMTARRQGFGARLAEGAWRLAESVHPDATRLVYAVKRLELPAHSARALKGLSIGYATATRGGSHHDTRPTPQYAQGFDRRGTSGKPAFAVRSQHFTAVGDSLVLCRFTAERGFGLFLDEPYARMLRAVTDWDVTVEELERTGERIINLERLFNVREGVPHPGHAAVEGPARADPRRPLGRRVLSAGRARRDARRVLRPPRLGRRRRADPRAPGCARPLRVRPIFSPAL
jgi:aldehyde:ferredoxin oxidoreductase